MGGTISVGVKTAHCSPDKHQNLRLGKHSGKTACVDCTLSQQKVALDRAVGDRAIRMHKGVSG